jgi:hypothetical protein
MQGDIRIKWTMLGEGKDGDQWLPQDLYRTRKEVDKHISDHVNHMAKEYGRNWRDEGYPKFKAVRVRVDLSLVG